MSVSPARSVVAPARRPLKRDRILESLANGDRLTRFDAERLGDHSLPTTVSDLQKLGVAVARKLVEREGRFGTFHCNVYWIEPKDREMAFLVLRGDAA